MSEEAALKRPYTHLLEGRDPSEILRKTPARLHAVLARMTPDEIAEKPAPNKWSVREILCHIADCEVAWAWRLRLIYGAENPLAQPFDQDAWGRSYHGAGYTAEAAMAVFTALRGWNLALIETLSGEDKRRPAHHPELGEITLETVVEIAAGHDLHHLTALESR